MTENLHEAETQKQEKCWAHFRNPDDPNGPYLECPNDSAGRYMNKHTHQYLYACLDHSMELTSSWIHASELT